MTFLTSVRNRCDRCLELDLPAGYDLAPGFEVLVDSRFELGERCLESGLEHLVERLVGDVHDGDVSRVTRSAVTETHQGIGWPLFLFFLGGGETLDGRREATA